MRAVSLDLFLFLCIGIAVSPIAVGQKPDSDTVLARAQAMVLVEKNRYLDAYPLLERIAELLPEDIEVWTYYGIAIATRSSTLSDPKERKAERKRAYEVLSKAKVLGTKNVMALHFLDQLDPDGGEEDNFNADDPEVEKALREGEGFFGRGEYQKAFESYERAYKLDPKNYEAVLFMGDCFYAQNKYAESEPWFAKAAALQPDRELAFRFWGDALLAQGKMAEATAQFINAFIAEPYSRYAWENVNKLTEKYGRRFSIKVIQPPGTKPFEDIRIDTTKLSKLDGTDLWAKYGEVRNKWRNETFKKEFPGKPYRHTLKEEVAALRAVAEAAVAAIKGNKIMNPHHSISNLITLHEKNLIEPYVLFLLADDDIAEDYAEYRKTSRASLRRFLAEHVFVF